MKAIPAWLKNEDVMYSAKGLVDAKTGEIYIGLKLTEAQIEELNSNLNVKVEAPKAPKTNKPKKETIVEETVEAEEETEEDEIILEVELDEEDSE